MFHTFVLFCLCCCRLVGVFGDEPKSVSVMEGVSFTLRSGVNELQTDDEILWRFGTNGPLIAKTNGVTSEILDALDGRFRGRLNLDKKTGSLTITNTRTEHSGVYEVEISTSSSETKHRFTINVNASTTPVFSTSSSSSSSSSGLSKEVHAHCCDSAEAVLRLVVTALMGVAAAAAAVLLINDIRATRGKTEETEQMS